MYLEAYAMRWFDNAGDGECSYYLVIVSKETLQQRQRCVERAETGRSFAPGTSLESVFAGSQLRKDPFAQD